MISPKVKQTNKEIAIHYDSLDRFYRCLWGEHIHHGFWKTGQESLDEATEQLIDLVVDGTKVTQGCHVIDIGSGYGATSRLLAKKWGARVTGITLSRAQWEFARNLNESNPHFLLGDFLNNQFLDNSFDVAVAIECSEHMGDKEKFFSEVHRLLKPGGRAVVCSWLAKEKPKKWEVDFLLEPICREGRLPNLGTESKYRELIQKNGLNLLHFEDIGSRVRWTWMICAWRICQAFLTDSSFRSYLFNTQSSDRIFAKTVYRILAASYLKSMRYGVFTLEKRID